MTLFLSIPKQRQSAFSFSPTPTHHYYTSLTAKDSEHDVSLAQRLASFFVGNAACRRFVIETINSHTRQDQHASYAAPPPPNLTLVLHFPTSISPLFLIEPDVQQNKEEDLREGYWILDTDYNNDCFEVSQLSMLENEGVNLDVIVCVLFVSSHTILH